MCDHDNICLDSDNALGPTDIRIDDPLTKDGVFDIRLIHRAEHSGLEAIRLWIVELPKVSNCLLLLVLEVC